MASPIDRDILTRLKNGKTPKPKPQTDWTKAKVLWTKVLESLKPEHVKK